MVSPCAIIKAVNGRVKVYKEYKAVPIINDLTVSISYIIPDNRSIEGNYLRISAVLVFIYVTAVPTFGYWGYEDRVPNGAVHSCNTCHYAGAFLDDFHAAGDQWTAALAALDSDGDGTTNGFELGDPYGVWSVGRPDPGDPFRVTNPDDAEDHPESE
jgi:hypothetical protein